MIKSKFIVVEGLEGAGKTQACTKIKNILKQHNVKHILLVRQPGSTLISEIIRKLVKTKFYSENISKETELLLMYAARIQLIQKKIKPALEKGIWVISDRHHLSSLAYQGGGLGIKIDIINQLELLFLDNYTPDLTVYLDVCPKIGLKRVLNRNSLDIIEKRSLEFFQRARKTYLKYIKLDEKSIKINANLNIDKVNENIKQQILIWFNKQLI